MASARKARPARTKAAASRNPLKSLAQRTDLQDEYKEVNTGLADKEMKRVKRQDIGEFLVCPSTLDFFGGLKLKSKRPSPDLHFGWYHMGEIAVFVYSSPPPDSCGWPS